MPGTRNKKLPLVELVTWSRRNTKCNFCKQWERDEEKYGPMYRCGSLTMHFFCMAFSSGISQVEPFTRGIFGFDQADVRRELKNVKNVICIYCGSGGANVKCEDSSCPQSFHFTCAWGKKLLIQIDQFRALCDSHSQSYSENDTVDKKQWTRGPFNFMEVFKTYSELQNAICSGKPIPSEKEIFLRHFQLESSPDKPVTPSTLVTTNSLPAPDQVQVVQKTLDPSTVSPRFEVSLPSNSFVLKFMRPENEEEFVEPTPYVGATDAKIEPSCPEVVEFSTTSSECSESVADTPQLCESPELTPALAEPVAGDSVVGLISCYDRSVGELPLMTEYNDDGECLIPSNLESIEPLDSLETYSDDFTHIDNELATVAGFDDVKQESEWQDSKPDKSSIFGLSSCFDKNDRRDSDQFYPTVISVNLASDPNSILTPFLGGRSVFRERSRSPSGNELLEPDIKPGGLEEPPDPDVSHRTSEPRTPCTCPETICLCCPEQRPLATGNDFAPLAVKNMPSTSLPESQGKRLAVIFSWSSLSSKSVPAPSPKLMSSISADAMSALGLSVRSGKRPGGEPTPAPASVPKKVRLSRKKSRSTTSTSQDDKSSTTTAEGHSSDVVNTNS